MKKYLFIPILIATTLLLFNCSEDEGDPSSSGYLSPPNWLQKTWYINSFKQSIIFRIVSDEIYTVINGSEFDYDSFLVEVGKLRNLQYSFVSDQQNVDASGEDYLITLSINSSSNLYYYYKKSNENTITYKQYFSTDSFDIASTDFQSARTNTFYDSYELESMSIPAWLQGTWTNASGFKYLFTADQLIYPDYNNSIFSNESGIFQIITDPDGDSQTKDYGYIRVDDTYDFYYFVENSDQTVYKYDLSTNLASYHITNTVTDYKDLFHLIKVD